MELLLSGLSTLFSWLVDYTIDISVLICLIFIIKTIASRKLPAWWNYSLWIILLLRMIIPFTFENYIRIPNIVPISIDQRLFDSVLIEEKFIVTDAAAEIASATQKGWNVKLDDAMAVLWLTCAIVFGTYVLVKNIKFRNTINKEPLLTDKKVMGLLVKCKSSMDAHTPLEITVTDKVKSPALFGYIRPRLLLPAGVLEKLDEAELSYIFMHELGHLKRHDIGVSWVVTFLHIFQWFNPLVWLAFYQMRIDQESACDASVLSRIKHNQTIDYASTIVGFLENFCRNRKLPAMLGILENQTQIKKRITMIVGYRKYSKVMMFFSTAVLVFIGIIFFSLAGLTKTTHEVTGLEPPVMQTSPLEVSEETAIEDNVVMHEKESMIFAGEIQKPPDILQEEVNEVRTGYEKKNRKRQESIVKVKENNIDHGNEGLESPDIAQKAPAVSQEKADDVKADHEKQNMQTQESIVRVQENNIDHRNERSKPPDIVQKTPAVSQEKTDDAKADHEKQNMQTQEAIVRVQRKNDDSGRTASSGSSKKAPAEVLKVFRKVYNILAENKDPLNHSFAESDTGQSAGKESLPDRKYASEGKNRNYLGLAGPALLRSENPDYSEGSPSFFQKKSNVREMHNLKEVDKPPKIVSYYPPLYPYEAQAKGIEGRVLLKFTVDSTGHVRNPQVVSAEPAGIFEQAALDTVMKYKLKPAIKDGKSVSSVVNLPIAFNISDRYLKFAQK